MPCRTMVATAGLARPPTMTKTTKKAKRALVAAAKVVVLVAKMAGGAGQYFEAERQRLRTEDRSSFGGRPRSTVDTHDADAARSQGAFLLGSSAPVHPTYHHRDSYEAVGGGMLDHHQQQHHHGGQPLQSFFAPYATTTSTQPSLHSHPLLLHQSLPPHHFPMAAYHHQGLAAESGLMPDDYAAAQFTPELEGAGEESPDVTESSRQFLLRLAHKTGTDEGEVMPFIVKLEREWLIQKEQLRCLDEETFVARLGFPASLAQSIREELSAGSTQVPNMLKYKVDQRHQSQHPQHHQSQHTPQPTQVAIPPPPPPQKEGGGGSSSSAGGGGGKEATTGRKRKRLTLAEWVSKVEQFSLDTNHDPSPFRVASIYQVECYCCGYAVNMNKPGQLYYLKRHVEGVRPDVRLSNHFKNYKRWRQQYHPGEPVDLTPEKLAPAKRQKSGDDNDEGEDDEVEGGQVLDYATDEGIRRIRSHSPSQGRRADRETPPVPVQPRSALSKSLGASGEGEIEVEGEGSIQLRALDFVAPLRHSGSGPLHGVPQLPEHMMPAPFSTQLHPIPPTPSHLPQTQAAVSLGHHLQFSQHHHYHLPPQPTFSAPLGHLPSYPSPPQQSQQLVDQYAAAFAYGLGHPPQQLHPQYPPVTHLRSFPPGAQHNERHS